MEQILRVDFQSQIAPVAFLKHSNYVHDYDIVLRIMCNYLRLICDVYEPIVHVARERKRAALIHESRQPGHGRAPLSSTFRCVLAISHSVC